MLRKLKAADPKWITSKERCVNDLITRTRTGETQVRYNDKSA